MTHHRNIQLAVILFVMVLYQCYCEEVYLLLCEGRKKFIDCPNNATIEIGSASYGYNGSNTSAREKCDPLAWFWELGNDETRCHAHHSADILTTKCGGRPECEVFASSNVFGDPCQGTRKFLEVFYYCRAGRPKIRETTMPNVVHDESSVVSKVMRTTTASIDVSETQMRTTTSSKVSSTLHWQDEHTGTTQPRAPTTATKSATSISTGTTPHRAPTIATKSTTSKSPGTKSTTFSTLPDPIKGISLVWVIVPLCVGIVVAFGCGFIVRSKYAPCYYRTETKKTGKDGVVLTLSDDMTTERSKRNVTA